LQFPDLLTQAVEESGLGEVLREIAATQQKHHSTTISSLPAKQCSSPNTMHPSSILKPQRNKPAGKPTHQRSLLKHTQSLPTPTLQTQTLNSPPTQQFLLKPTTQQSLLRSPAQISLLSSAQPHTISTPLAQQSLLKPPTRNPTPSAQISLLTSTLQTQPFASTPPKQSSPQTCTLKSNQQKPGLKVKSFTCHPRPTPYLSKSNTQHSQIHISTPPKQQSLPKSSQHNTSPPSLPPNHKSLFDSKPHWQTDTTTANAYTSK
jgi:hypothetical protein